MIYSSTPQLLWCLWNVTVLKTKHLLLGKGYSTPVQKICFFFELYHKFFIYFVYKFKQRKSVFNHNGWNYLSSLIPTLLSWSLLSQLLIGTSDADTFRTNTFELLNVNFCNNLLPLFLLHSTQMFPKSNPFPCTYVSLLGIKYNIRKCNVGRYHKKGVRPKNSPESWQRVS